MPPSLPIVLIRVALIPGICIGIRPIPAFLMVSESVKYAIQVPILLFAYYSRIKVVMQAKITKAKLILTTHSIVLP